MKEFLIAREKAYQQQIDDNQARLNNPHTSENERRMIRHNQIMVSAYQLECLSILAHLNGDFN